MPTGNFGSHRYWIFDLDGTLTMPQHDFNAFRQAHDLPFDRPILEAIHALPPLEASSLLQALQDWEWSLAEQAKPQPGAIELLTTLQQRNCSRLYGSEYDPANMQVWTKQFCFTNWEIRR